MRQRYTHRFGCWLIACSSIFFFRISVPVYAVLCPLDDPCKSVTATYERISCYSIVVHACSSERESMQAQLVYLDTNVSLTTAKIAQASEKALTLEKDIQNIGQKVDALESSLIDVTKVFLDRVIATYKYSDAPFLALILTRQGPGSAFDKYKYVQAVQNHDRRVLFSLQNSKVNFQDQKNLREAKKAELQQIRMQLQQEELALSVQKKEKEIFLTTTKQNETKYLQELASAKKEAGEIEKAASILSAAGVPKHVQRGDVIGVMGNSGFSTGAHLHFAVYDLKENQLNSFSFEKGNESPFLYLTPREMLFEPSSCDDVSPHDQTKKTVGFGSWDWPMRNPVISQCFGHTPWSWRYQSGGHNGVDMWDDTDTLIRAVESGNAYTYRGGQSAGNGVFIFHDNGKMTLYWHLQ